MSEKFTDFTIKREAEIHFGEHETHLSFNSDWQSEAFDDWFQSEGSKHFAEWLEKNAENYRE